MEAPVILTCKHCAWHVEGLPDIADAHTSMTGHDRVTMSYEGWEQPE